MDASGLEWTAGEGCVSPGSASLHLGLLMVSPLRGFCRFAAGFSVRPPKKNLRHLRHLRIKQKFLALRIHGCSITIYCHELCVADLQDGRASLHYIPIVCHSGRLAQLVRAPRLHRGCRRFESVIAHHCPNRHRIGGYCGQSVRCSCLRATQALSQEKETSHERAFDWRRRS